MVDDNITDFKKLSKASLMCVRIFLIIYMSFLAIELLIFGWGILGLEICSIAGDYFPIFGLLATIVWIYTLCKFISKTKKFLGSLFNKTKFETVMKNIRIIIFYIVVSLALIGIVGITILNDNTPIILSLFLVVPLSSLLLISMCEKMIFNKQLKNINKEQLKMELESSKKSIYDFHSSIITPIYITENFVYAQGSGVACINDILWMHLNKTTIDVPHPTSPYYVATDVKTGTSVVLYLNNGKKVYMRIDGLGTGNKIIEEIQKRNFDILVGNIVENKKRYKQLVKK